MKLLLVAAALALLARILRWGLPWDGWKRSRPRVHPLPPAIEEGGLVEPETGLDDPRLELTPEQAARIWQGIVQELGCLCPCHDAHDARAEAIASEPTPRRPDPGDREKAW